MCAHFDFAFEYKYTTLRIITPLYFRDQQHVQENKIDKIAYLQKIETT
jgi:hypothetical protein